MANENTKKKTMVNHRSFYLLGIFILILVISIGILAISNRTDDRIVLIVTKDQTDTASLNPTRMQVAAEMAMLQYEKTTVKSVNIKNHYISYVGDEEEGYRLAKEQLETNPAVVAIVGDFNSKGTELLASLAEEYKIPHISFFATEDSIFNDKPWSFSYRNRLVQERDIMLEVLTDHTSTEKLAVVSCDLRNVSQRWEQLETVLAANKIELHSSEVFPSANQDFRQYIEWLKEEQNQFDTIALFLSSGQIEHFLQQLTMADINKPVVTAGVTMSVEGVSELQGIELPIYTFVPEVFLKVDKTDDFAFQSFVERYRVAIGYHRFDSLGPWIYDGLGLLYELIAEEGSSEQMKDALMEYSQQRMIGPVSFNENGTLKDSTLRIVRIDQGRFIEVDSR